MLRGGYDRNHDHQLERGTALTSYGVEQMGPIVQDYDTLRNGGRSRLCGVRLEDYADALPVRR